VPSFLLSGGMGGRVGRWSKSSVRKKISLTPILRTRSSQAAGRKFPRRKMETNSRLMVLFTRSQMGPRPDGLRGPLKDIGGRETR